MKHQYRPVSASKKDQILDAAEQAILQKGVSATTIEELIVAVGLSKNGFFYHFQDKSQLIEAILNRNLKIDAAWFDGLLAAAHQNSNTPLGRFLAFLDLLATEMNSMPNGHPGCMTTACCYQDRLLTQSVKNVAAEILMQWRQICLTQLQEVAAHHPPGSDIDLEELADMLPALIDGAIIFSRVVADQSVLPRQIRLYRKLIENTFTSSNH